MSMSISELRLVLRDRCGGTIVGRLGDASLPVKAGVDAPGYNSRDRCWLDRSPLPTRGPFAVKKISGRPRPSIGKDVCHAMPSLPGR